MVARALFSSPSTTVVMISNTSFIPYKTLGQTTVEDNVYKFEVKSVQSKITTKNWHQCFRDFCEKWITVICVVCLDTSFTSLSGILPNGNSGNAELSVKEGFEQSTSAYIMLISLCWATEMRDSALNCAIYDLRNPFDIVTSSWFRADLSLTDSTTTTSGVSLVWSDIHCLRYVPNQDALGLFLPFSKKIWLCTFVH